MKARKRVGSRRVVGRGIVQDAERIRSDSRQTLRG